MHSDLDSSRGRSRQNGPAHMHNLQTVKTRGGLSGQLGGANGPAQPPHEHARPAIAQEAPALLSALSWPLQKASGPGPSPMVAAHRGPHQDQRGPLPPSAFAFRGEVTGSHFPQTHAPCFIFLKEKCAWA